MKKGNKKAIPVYDIHALSDVRHMRRDITAEGFAHYLSRHPDLEFPHRHSFFHLVYFTAGGGTHTIDFRTFDIVLGQIYFMAPGQVHTWNFEGDMDGYLINFSEELMYSFLREERYLEQFPFLSGIADDSVVQLKAARATVEATMKEIIKESVGNAPMATEMIRIKLLSLFIHVLREIAPVSERMIPGTNATVMHNFKNLVERNYSRIRLPRDYAAMLYVTPNYLNALCKDVVGKSAGEIIRDRLLLEAKRMLAATNISVSEIAWQLHFKDNSYFTKFFKKYESVTPEQFREQSKQKQ